MAELKVLSSNRGLDIPHINGDSNQSIGSFFKEEELTVCEPKNFSNLDSKSCLQNKRSGGEGRKEHCFMKQRIPEAWEKQRKSSSTESNDVKKELTEMWSKERTSDQRAIQARRHSQYILSDNSGFPLKARSMSLDRVSILQADQFDQISIEEKQLSLEKLLKVDTLKQRYLLQLGSPREGVNVKSSSKKKSLLKPLESSHDLRSLEKPDVSAFFKKSLEASTKDNATVSNKNSPRSSNKIQLRESLRAWKALERNDIKKRKSNPSIHNPGIQQCMETTDQNQLSKLKGRQSQKDLNILASITKPIMLQNSAINNDNGDSHRKQMFENSSFTTFGRHNLLRGESIVTRVGTGAVSNKSSIDIPRKKSEAKGGHEKGKNVATGIPMNIGSKTERPTERAVDGGIMDRPAKDQQKIKSYWKEERKERKSIMKEPGVVKLSKRKDENKKVLFNKKVIRIVIYRKPVAEHNNLTIEKRRKNSCDF